MEKVYNIPLTEITLVQLYHFEFEHIFDELHIHKAIVDNLGGIYVHTKVYITSANNQVFK